MEVTYLHGQGWGVGFTRVDDQLLAGLIDDAASCLAASQSAGPAQHQHKTHLKGKL